MSDRFIIYAIKWRYKPYVRLVWSTKDLITTRAGKVSRLSSILNYFNVVNFTEKTENPQLQDFIKHHWNSLKDTTIDDVEFLELESLDLKTLTVKDVKRELNYHSVMFAIDGYTVLNFNRYKVRLPKVNNNMNQNETKDLKLKDSMDTLVKSLAEDSEYLNSWHANIACAALDEGVDYDSAQRIASRFLSNLTKGAANSLANHNELTGQNIK